MDKAIIDFFDERKEGWLKKNVKASMSDAEKAQLEIDCAVVFSAKNWLPHAANRAGQISIATHPCTFSHPSSRKNKNGYASSIIATSQQANDGFLRSGNVAVATDALGNAAALDVYKFLMVELSDGQTLLQHMQQDTEYAKAALSISSPTAEQDYESLKQGFLAMTETSGEVVTSSKIKQIYFPLNSGDKDAVDYHQLSVLTPSGIVFDLRKRLDTLRFGEDVKALRENKKKNQFGEGYKEIYNLTTIAYGGTKPQNISVLNNQNGGKAHLFSSMPPVLFKRDLHFPSRDFFAQNVYYGACRTVFLKLHNLYQQESNNTDVRIQRDEYYQDIIDYVIEKLWQIRAIAKDQFLAEYSQLSKSQRIWLQVNETPEDDVWLDDVLKKITHFLFNGYERTLAKKAIKFGDMEFKHMQKIVEKNKEIIR
jgi:CRISPR-associated protein Csy1